MFLLFASTSDVEPIDLQLSLEIAQSPQSVQRVQLKCMFCFLHQFLLNNIFLFGMFVRIELSHVYVLFVEVRRTSCQSCHRFNYVALDEREYVYQIQHNFTAAEKSEIWFRFLTAVAFLSLAFQNEAIYVNSI